MTSGSTAGLFTIACKEESFDLAPLILEKKIENLFELLVLFPFFPRLPLLFFFSMFSVGFAKDDSSMGLEECSLGRMEAYSTEGLPYSLLLEASCSDFGPFLKKNVLKDPQDGGRSIFLHGNTFVLFATGSRESLGHCKETVF